MMSPESSWDSDHFPTCRTRQAPYEVFGAAALDDIEIETLREALRSIETARKDREARENANGDGA